MARTVGKLDSVRAMGAEAVVADALDFAAVEAAVARAEPEVVVHELTAIPAKIDPRPFAEEFGATNQLRRMGTRNLVAAAVTAGARRVVAQSIAQAYKPVGGWIKTEEDQLYDGAPPCSGHLQCHQRARGDRAERERYRGARAPVRQFLWTGHEIRDEAQTLSWCANSGSRSPAGAQRTGRSSTFTTRRRPCGRYSTATQGSTTSLTTSQQRSRSGCRCTPAPSVPLRRQRRGPPTATTGPTECYVSEARLTTKPNSNSRGLPVTHHGGKGSAHGSPDCRTLGTAPREQVWLVARLAPAN